MTRCPAPRPVTFALATLTISTLLYPGALLRGEVFFERDLHLDWYARLAALGRALAQGAWPLWEPGLGFGQPLLGDPSVQVLYPVTWLALALPWSVAYTAFVLVHVFVGGLGAARLASRLGAGNVGSWTTGLAFVLSGPVQSTLNLWHHFAGTAWMPWVLLALDGAVRRPSVVTLLALAAAAGLQVLAGSADLCAMTLALAVVLAVVRLAPGRVRRAVALPALAACLGALALAAALTCALWWPAADLLSRSSRRDLPEDVRSAWSVPAAGLARLVAPLDPGRVPYAPGRWTSLYDRPAPPLLLSLYVGSPLLGLACLSLLDRRRRGRAVLLAALALAAVILAMGLHGPLYGPVAGFVPGMKSFRYPSKALIPASLLVALLAGCGARTIVSATRPARSRQLVAALALIGSASTLLLSRRYGADAGWSPLLGLAFALVLMLPEARLNRRLAGAALAAIPVIDLVAVHQELNPTAPAALVLEPPPVVAALRRDDGMRAHVWDYYTLPGDSERWLGRPFAEMDSLGPAGIDRRILTVAAHRQALILSTGTFFGIETSFDLDTRGLYPSELNDLIHLLRHVAGTPVHARLLRMGAVGKLVTLHDPGIEGLVLERTLPTLFGIPIRIYAVPDAQPRAWLVGRTRHADGEAAVGALLDPAFDPRQEAIVASAVPLGSHEPCSGEIRWLDRRADRLKLETQCRRAALLVLADAYDPGWRATVDGTPAEVVRANLALRAVPVPAGRHLVELLYRPRAVVGGIWVSFGALLAAAVLLVASRRRRPTSEG